MPADPAVLDDLIARLEAATGPDREIDHDICVALYPEMGRAYPLCAGDEPIFWNEPYRKRPVPLLTALLDPTLHLVALKLRGWHVGMQPWFYEATERVTCRAYVIRPRWADYTPRDDWFDAHHAEAATASHAVLIALCRALRQGADHV